MSHFALYFGYLVALHTHNNGAQSVTCSNAETLRQTHELGPNDVSDRHCPVETGSTVERGVLRN